MESQLQNDKKPFDKVGILRKFASVGSGYHSSESPAPKRRETAHGGDFEAKSIQVGGCPTQILQFTRKPSPAPKKKLSHGTQTNIVPDISVAPPVEPTRSKSLNDNRRNSRRFSVVNFNTTGEETNMLDNTIANERIDVLNDGRALYRARSMSIYSVRDSDSVDSEDDAIPSTLSISPPVLPLAFANAMLTLYVVQSPEDCKLHLLAFCLIAGSLTLFMSILGLVAGLLVKMAVADGRVSSQERTVIWCIVHQNNFFVSVQIALFLTLFCYVFAYFKKVHYTDTRHPYYCKRNVYMFCMVLSSVMVLAGIIGTFFYFWLRTVDTRRQTNKNKDKI